MVIEDLDSYWQKDLERQSYKPFVIFIQTTVLINLLYIFYDYYLAYSIWKLLLVYRVFTALNGIILYLLFKLKKITGQSMTYGFLFPLFFEFSFGASHLDNPLTLLMWNMSLFLGILYIFSILLFHWIHTFTICISFFIIYWIHYLVYGNLSFSQMIVSGFFLFIGMVFIPYISNIKYSSARENFFLRFEIELQKQELEKKNKELENIANIDYHTGALNRRAGYERIRQSMAATNLDNESFALSFIDINNLKLINDSFGHDKGDELIERVSNILKTYMKQNDYLIRIGGDEFLMVLIGANIQIAGELFIKIVDELNHFNSLRIAEYDMAISYGLAEYNNKSNISLDELIRRADREMYLHKQTNRKSNS